MNASFVLKMIEEICPFMKRRVGMLPENKKIFDEIYQCAKEIEPCDKYRDGDDRKFWLWMDRGSLEEFADAFKDEFIKISYEGEEEKTEVDYEKMKERRLEYFPEEVVWFKLYLAEHDGNRGLCLGNRMLIDTRENLSERMDMAPLLEWILAAEKKCIDMIKQGTYSKFIAENLPYRHRSGIVKMGTYWKYVPEDKERLFGGIDPDELAEFLAWDKDEDNGWEAMTQNDYFRICDCLYDLVEVKTKYPMYKEDAPEEPLTPRECYLAYAANYDSAKPFLDLEGDSAEAFDDFLVNRHTEHHTWEVCLVPNVHLYPKKVNGKYYISVWLDHKEDYALLVHLVLKMREKGIPVQKPERVEEAMSGEQMTDIVPVGDNFDARYAYENGFRSAERRWLPKRKGEELAKEIQWFPTGEWRVEK